MQWSLYLSTELLADGNPVEDVSSSSVALLVPFSPCCSVDKNLVETFATRAWAWVNIESLRTPLTSPAILNLDTQHRDWVRLGALRAGPASSRQVRAYYFFLKHLGRVVRKLVNVNLELNVNWSITFSCLKMFSTSNVWCSLRLLQLNTEGQTI